jgi:hypothetical protein
MIDVHSTSSKVFIATQYLRHRSFYTQMYHFVISLSNRIAVDQVALERNTVSMLHQYSCIYLRFSDRHIDSGVGIELFAPDNNANHIETRSSGVPLPACYHPKLSRQSASLRC